MIRFVTSADTEKLLAMVKATNMFEADEINEIGDRLSAFLNGEDNSIWLVCEESGLEGLAYCAPEPMTKGTWNLLMLFVNKSAKGRGHGTDLINAIERQVAVRDGRLLIVETSGIDDYAQAQRFYGKCDFKEVARIPDFYDAGDGKIIFSKHLGEKNTRPRDAGKSTQAAKVEN